VERSDTPPSVGPLFNSTLKGVPPVGERTDELLTFLGSGDASLRSRWHRYAMLRTFNSSGGASTPG